MKLLSFLSSLLGKNKSIRITEKIKKLPHPQGSFVVIRHVIVKDVKPGLLEVFLNGQHLTETEDYGFIDKNRKIVFARSIGRNGSPDRVTVKNGKESMTWDTAGPIECYIMSVVK